MRWGQTVPLGVRGRSPLSPLEVLAAACSSLPPRQGSRVPTVPAGSTCSPTRARGFAPMGLLSCSEGLNAFKAIKQGLSKDFNAFKCNLRAFKAKQTQVAVMLLKCLVPSAPLRGSFSGFWPIFPVFPVAGLHCSPHPTGKPGMGPAAFSLKQARRRWVPAT